MGYLCDNEDGQPAAMLLTNLENGDTTALCGPCVPGWVFALAASFRESGIEDPTLTSPGNGEAAGEGGAALNPSRPKRGRRGRQEIPPELTSEESPFSDPTPVDE